MKFAVAWVGPVSAAQVSGATVPDAPMTFVNCTGDGSPDCSQIGSGIGAAAGGSIVRGLLAKAGVPDGQLILGSFSAGHEIAKPALMSAADRALVRAVLLADSTYTSWQSPGVPLPPEGYVRYAIDAIDRPQLFVATSRKSPIGQYPSSDDTVEALRREVERRTGRKFERVDGLPGVPLKPETTYRLGNAWLAIYPPSISHGEHATKLAPMVWRGMLLPWLAGADGGGLGLRVLVAALGAAAGWAAARQIMLRLPRR